MSYFSMSLIKDDGILDKKNTHPAPKHTPLVSYGRCGCRDQCVACVQWGWREG